VSKFFKALEKVEQEREPVVATTPVAEPAEPATEPRREAPHPEPKRPEPRPEPPRIEPKPEPAHREPAHREPPRSETAPRPRPEVAAPVTTPSAPAPTAAAPSTAAPGNGATSTAAPSNGAPSTAAPSNGAPTAAPTNGAPATRTPAPAPAPVYGAPIRENGATFGRRGFAWQLDGEAETEPGQLDDHLVSLLEPTSHAAEQYRAVRLAIETFRHERGTRTVGVTSPGRGDGRTITALNVAGALAQAPDARVVLVEADLRHPGVARALGLPAGRGLSTYLLDPSMNVDAVVSRPAGVAFAVVPSGAASSMPYELLKSPRLASLLAALRDRFDYVVLDTPPALPYPDVGILRDLVDGFVVVVRANRTPRELLRDCMNVVGRQRGLGLIFNDDERSTLTTIDYDEPSWRRLMPRQLGGKVA
jgi:capsular exopolysaccharide synthesis family protein